MPALLRETGLFLFALSLPLSVAGANIGWVVLLAGLVAGGASRDLRRAALADPLLLPWAGYLAVLALSSLFGIDPARSLRQLPTDLARVVVYFVLTHALRGRNPAPFLAAYLAGAVGAAGCGLWQVLRVYTASGRVAYAHGTLHHVTYGEILAFALSLCLCAALFERRRSWLRLWPALILGMNAALLASPAGGAGLGTAAAWLGCLAWHAKGRRRVLALGALNIVVFGAAFAAASRFVPAASLVERVRSMASASFHSNRDRLTAWRVGLAVFRDHPVLGVGPRNFRQVFADYHAEPIQGERNWGNVHNLYLHQLAERGLVGGGALLWLFWTMLALAWRRFRQDPTPWRLHALAFLPGFFVMNLTETSFQHELIAYNLCWLLALAGSKGSA